MSEVLKIRLAARCEAAGRSENEDNFLVAQDLSVSDSKYDTDKVFSLGNKGTLLLVCDGMGGMNAGEVASAIGVDTIKELFTPQLLTSDVLADDESVCAYMKRAIVKADSCVKEEAQKDDSKRGMGSTAVMAWLLGHKVYVAWCGDSRCYRYNPATGLEQLSHDHSYVQDLVDTGQLSPELAFDHPNKNIITRSLGDPRGAARPDVKVYDMFPGDVILLCSDGLNDSLRDSEIEQSISRSLTSMASCKDALWNDSYQAGWHDNVTIVLAQVVDENSKPVQQMGTPAINPTAKPVEDVQQEVSSTITNFPKSSPKLNWKVIIVIVVVFSLVAVALTLAFKSDILKKIIKSSSKEDYSYSLIIGLKQDKFSSVKYDDMLDTVNKYVDLYKSANGSSAQKNEAMTHLDTLMGSAIELLTIDEGNPKASELKESITNIRTNL